MFVLLDIEWIENRQHHICPTQIAAMRVDEQWNCWDQFCSRIRPRDDSFFDWSNVAYAGGTPSDFLHAPDLHHVLTDLQNWLRKDDILCVWYANSRNILKSIYKLVHGHKVPQRIVVLNEYLVPFLAERKMKKGNAYILCDKYGALPPKPKHHSQNDVVAIQKALGCIHYPAAFLYGNKPSSTPTPAAPKAPPISSEMQPYQLEVNAGIFHKVGCDAIPQNAVLRGYQTLKYFFRKKPIACPHCLKEEVRKANRARNQDIIDRTQYQFVYAKHSDVFHRRGCSAILNTTDAILGTAYYDTVAKTGRRPCKLCHPAPDTQLSAAQKKRMIKTIENATIPTRALNSQETRAYNRYVEARNERYTTFPKAFESDTEKADFYELTQPRYAFFCAAGYQTFHRRNCRKLHGLSHISGFSTYKDAVRAGHTPCKFCKPTAKLDLEYSIPITNQKRKGETVNDLKFLCEEQGYHYEIADQLFCFSTPVGKWKIDFSSTPYVVHHINLIRAPNNDYCYHRQPRLFLSLLDAFDYIHHHDRNLLSRTPSRTELSAAAE